MLCASNNLTRALENKDYYTAFRFLQERMELNGKIRKETEEEECIEEEAEV